MLICIQGENVLVKIFKDGECIIKTDSEIIIELPNSILKIKGDLIEHQNKKIKNKVECFMVRNTKEIM